MSSAITAGTRVRLARTWRNPARTGGHNVRVEGTVAAYTDFGDGTGSLLLTDVEHDFRGYWAAPSSDADQATTVEVLRAEGGE